MLEVVLLSRHALLRKSQKQSSDVRSVVGKMQNADCKAGSVGVEEGKQKRKSRAGRKDEDWTKVKCAYGELAGVEEAKDWAALQVWKKKIKKEKMQKIV